MRNPTLPLEQGLYDPRFEHDSCGVGFVCNIKGERSGEIVRQGLEVLSRLAHRGAVVNNRAAGAAERIHAFAVAVEVEGAAVDRRRHHQPGAYRRQDRASLQRPGDPCARRFAERRCGKLSFKRRLFEITVDA